jgi:hypothetical protein
MDRSGVSRQRRKRRVERGAFGKKADICLTDWLAPVTVFQNETVGMRSCASTPGGGFVGRESRPLTIRAKRK